MPVCSHRADLFWKRHVHPMRYIRHTCTGAKRGSAVEGRTAMAVPSIQVQENIDTHALEMASPKESVQADISLTFQRRS